MEITTAQIKELRDQTGVSMMQCKKALEEAAGDKTKALEILRKKSGEFAAKKTDRTLGAGTVASYIHNTGASGTIVVLRSETDFVSDNQEFKNLARDIAMHVTATKPASIEALLAEPFIKDPQVTIKNLIDTASHKFGEKIELSSFDRRDINE